MNKKSKTTNNKTVKKKSNSKSLKNDLLETKDKYLRLYSEFENYRRRTSKEKVEMINSANKELISLILPIIDDFERAIKLTSKENLDTSMEGFELIFQKLNSLLEKQGVKKMEIKTGDDFDSDFHEAITNQVLNDLISKIDPIYMQITGEFFVRGGISTTVVVEHNK